MHTNFKFLAFIFFMPFAMLFAQEATIKEEVLTMNTYMFSDPDPVANIGRIYPYFRFDGYASKGENRDWKMVVLENEFIKVYVSPQVGGKVWGAIEKSTGKEFMYFNDAVKFRDVAMRGAWTSGGLEYNFGDIGHIPTCATPVDYVIRKNKDGSVSCIVGAIDLPSRTKWNVEIKLPKDKAYFETKVTWFNSSSIPVTYYHWMNAAAKAKGDLEFIAPGNKRLGHGGEIGEWPMENNRDISRYEQNNFGRYKSYHIVNGYADFFGGYWHDDDFGFGHHSTYDDKPGKKLWIWGLSDQGMIWEDLLTDTKGQYVEYQAGKLFNQAAESSTRSPFKHREFSPNDTDRMDEIWFPLKGTKGIEAASEYGVLNVERTNNKVDLFLSPLQPLNQELKIMVDGKIIYTKKLNQAPLALFTHGFSLDNSKDFEVELGTKLLYYNSNSKKNTVDRPLTTEGDFNWESSYGLYINGLELEKQRRYEASQESYQKSIEKEPTFLPSLSRLALSHYRANNLQEGLKFARKALSIDTYDGLSNFVFGLINNDLGEIQLAKSGFSIASQSTEFRSSSYTELAKLFLKENDLHKALHYAEKSLVFNTLNLGALEIKAAIYRRQNKKTQALEILRKIDELDATSHFKNFEYVLFEEMTPDLFKNQISNEFPFESYLELASKYMALGANDDALKVLELAPEHVIVSLWKAHLDVENESTHLATALAMSPEMVFPHRKESGSILKSFNEKTEHWKLKYYLALQQWNTGNLEMAKTLFNACGNQPNFVAFYLAKIKLFDDKALTNEALNRAEEIDANDWRSKLARIEYLYEEENYLSASKIAKRAFDKNPEKAVIGMLYAKSLIKLKDYRRCLKFLEKFNVLPFEGATQGRAIYHETSIRLALEAFQQKKYKKAIEYANKAKLWPKNLGVGKHYDVDERLSNFLIANAYEKLGKNNEASNYNVEVANHKITSNQPQGSKLYFQLAALKKLGYNDRIELLKVFFQDKTQMNVYVKWVLSHFNESDSEALKSQILNDKVVVQLYDTKFVDRQFKLVTEVVEGISN